MFAFSLLSFFKTDDTVLSSELVELIKSYPGLEVLYNILNDVITRASSGVTIITAVMSLWSAGKGLYIITGGITRIYRLPEKRFWLIRRVYAMGYTVVMLIIMFAVFLILSVSLFFGKGINTLLSDIFPSWIVFAVTYALMIVLQIIAITFALMLYLRTRIKNKRYTKFKVLLPGSVITVVGWNVIIFGTMLYNKYFSTSSVYGSLSAVMISMITVYFLMYVLLYGIQFNCIYRERIYRFMYRRKLKREKADLSADRKTGEASVNRG